MPADLASAEAIKRLAKKVDSPAKFAVLRHLRDVGFIQHGPNMDRDVVAILQELADAELVDPGFNQNGKPFIWVSNHNGEQVLKEIEESPLPESLNSRLKITPGARAMLATLPNAEALAVLVAAETLQAQPLETWPRERVMRLNSVNPLFLLNVAPDLRAFLRVLDSGDIEMSDVVREETLQMYAERYRAESKAG